MFKNILFWCEFPKETDWFRLNELLKEYNLKIRTYVAVKDIKEFKEIKKNKFSNITIEGCWPTLSFKDGYWFSGHSSKRAIDSLDQFKNCSMKIDLETPIPLNKSFSNPISLSVAVLKDFLKSGKNNKYLKKKIKSLSKSSSVILSTYPMPEFILNKIGFLKSNKIKYNYFYYSTVFPSFLKPIYKFYFKQFIKSKPKETYFALGLIGTGIFMDETVYKDLNEFKKEVDFFYSQGVNNLVLFELSALTKREHPEEWISYLKSISIK